MENINIFVTNFGKYAEGQLEGEWVNLPISQEAMKEVYQRIGVDNERYEEIFITDYESPISSLEIGEYSNISELNYLASLLNEMDEGDKNKFEAAIDVESVSSIADLINLTDNLDCYEFMEGITNETEYGDYLLYESGMYDERIPAELQMYIDTEALGRDMSINELGMFTDKGYCIHNQSENVDFYKGKGDIPKEYIISPSIISQEKKSVLANLAEKAEQIKSDSQNMDAANKANVKHQESERE